MEGASSPHEGKENISVKERLFELIRSGTDPHFEDIRPERLEEKDIEIYEKFLNKTLTLEELTEWKDDIFATENTREKTESKNPIFGGPYSDRGNFAAYMINQFAYLQMEQFGRHGGSPPSE